MNAGLSNLATLKAWLLPAGMVTSTDYDVQILALGKGVAGQLERHCNRGLGRVVGDVFECTADRSHVSLPRYPVEAITTMEQRDTRVAAWVPLVLDSTIEQQALDRGMLYFAASLGHWWSRIRITYTGGYWFNEQEPAYEPPVTPTEQDPDLSIIPAGATALPADLLLAFHLQCEAVWKAHDKLGLSIAEKPAAPLTADLTEQVKSILGSHRRLNLT